MKKKLNEDLNSIANDTMEFLNEIANSYPSAISLASGRPDSRFFNLEKIDYYINTYLNFISETKKKPLNALLSNLGQYSEASGIINEIVSKYLLVEYGLETAPEDLLINVGTQESLLISVLTLCSKNNDVIIVEDPCYVGIKNYALIAGYEISGVKLNADGMCLETLEKKILKFQEIGKHVKVVYVVSDFQNPSGIRMSVEKRKQIIELAEKYDFFILEDNAYGDFCFVNEMYPTLKKLDKYRRVIYLHTFSKLIYPSVRIGVMVADYRFEDGSRLSNQLKKVKGYTTVNTSSINQAIIAGILIDNNFSLRKYNEKKIENLREKKILTLDALHKCFRTNNEEWCKNVKWNDPEGGFFMVIDLPFDVTEHDVIACAERFEVIFTPMFFFQLDEINTKNIRIAYSNIKEDNIIIAVERLYNFFKNKIENGKTKY
ncbi:PLP-dependent aminotransferase family protein [Chryseobacterium sp. JJR-5R]|uniref:aminotransferase-like domain-containing protein n=1 Tax=Chryseobacterium sp. JJR-5R TaxID=3093923 RepID=UPI002A74E88B|nr:PLP-dependent aminotransferase family protein [Chryseobacterium sp. JJR-5R]WPO84496.1 PLP-dependent aminotransferase family protein [Chryseobacterium sp. JJR-5R]